MRRERGLGGHEESESAAQKLLREARESEEWFVIADARMFEFDLTDEEEVRVQEARRALSHVRKMAMHPRFLDKDGNLSLEKMRHVWQEAPRDIDVARSHNDREAFDNITEGLAGLAGMMGRERVPSIGDFVQAADNVGQLRGKGDAQIKKDLRRVRRANYDHRTGVVENFEPNPLYEKAVIYFNRHRH